MASFLQEIFIECLLCPISDRKLLKIKEDIPDIGFYYKQRKTHLGTLNYVLWDIQIERWFSICLKGRKKKGRNKGRSREEKRKNGWSVHNFSKARDPSAFHI